MSALGDSSQTAPNLGTSKQTGERDEDLANGSEWVNVAKTVREIDVAKVSDAKEDIDNLLVFAGLFSAILTAFLVESYHALQPDTDSEMLFLLHRIATQNYTISSGFLNTSSPFPVRRPFQAPTWALRVNGLWFASLIFSLAAASLGILVKAWLREYLSSQWISPQQKLRSRQYRYPALGKWKVFEIAAVLPLLLQLALALFFVGLCFFTASIDPRMALTSIPLVSAWAFFLVATTIAPLFNPRCPYKVPGLRRAFQSARRHLFPHIARSHKLETVLREEEEAVSGALDDAEILMEMDALLAEDSLLNMFLAACWQTTPNPAYCVRFALRLIRHRIPSLPPIDCLKAAQLTCFVNLTELSQRAYNEFMNAFARLLKRAPGPYSPSSPGWVHDAVLILLSGSIHPYPTNALTILRAFLNDTNTSWFMGDVVGARIVPCLQTGLPLPPLALQLGSIFSLTSQSDSPPGSIDFPLRLYNRALKAVSGLPDTSAQSHLFRTLHSTPDLEKDKRALPILLDLSSYLFTVLLGLADYTGKIPARSPDSFLILLHLANRLQTYHVGDAAYVVQRWWSSRYNRYWTMLLLTTALMMESPRDELQLNVWPVVERAWSLADENTRDVMLESSVFVAANCNQGPYRPENGYHVIDLVAFTFLHLRLFKFALHRGEHMEAWKNLWAQTQMALRKYEYQNDWEAGRSQIFDESFGGEYDGEHVLERDREMAEEALRLVDALDRHVDSTTDGESLIPNELVVAVGRFVLPERASQFRLARLRPPTV